VKNNGLGARKKDIRVKNKGLGASKKDIRVNNKGLGARNIGLKTMFKTKYARLSTMRASTVGSGLVFLGRECVFKDFGESLVC
jgi:hypothetical protein